MKRKVLVLEDEENIRSFVVLNLRRAGYEIVQAGTGEEALAKYDENPDIAVAVLDVMLPGIDGYEVCRTLRAKGYAAGVIMLTARTQEADKVTGLMTGSGRLCNQALFRGRAGGACGRAVPARVRQPVCR